MNVIIFRNYKQRRRNEKKKIQFMKQLSEALLMRQKFCTAGDKKSTLL